MPMHTRTRRFVSAVALVTTALLAAACSSSSGDGATGTTSTSQETTQTPAESTATTEESTAASETDSTTAATDTETSTESSTAASPIELPSRIKDAGVILAGSPTTNPPYISLDGEDLVGIIPDLANAAGDILGVPVKFESMAFPGIMPAIQAKKIDIAWTVMNDTKEREETMDFVDFIRVSASFLIPAANPHKIEGIEDLCGLRVGTLAGSAQADLLDQQNTTCTGAGKPAIDIKLYQNQSDEVAQLRSGNLDAQFGGTAAMKFTASKIDDGTTFVTATKTYLGGVFGIAVPKDLPQLTTALQQALQQLAQSGDYEKILAKYADEGDALTADEIVVNGIGTGQLN